MILSQSGFCYLPSGPPNRVSIAWGTNTFNFFPKVNLSVSFTKMAMVVVEHKKAIQPPRSPVLDMPLHIFMAFLMEEKLEKLRDIRQCQSRGTYQSLFEILKSWLAFRALLQQGTVSHSQSFMWKFCYCCKIKVTISGSF